jgi:hypothetical protein
MEIRKRNKKSYIYNIESKQKRNRLTLRIPLELHNEVKIICEKEGITESVFYNLAILEKCEKYNDS